MRYAGFWRRSTAYGYDVILLQGITLLVMLIGYGFPSMEQFLRLDPAVSLWFSTATNLYFVFSAIYNIAMVASPLQTTLGKQACGLIVVTDTGARLGYVQSTIRHVLSGASMAMGGLGYITMFFNREKMALHDIIGKTRVIYKEVV